jgi:hypothetical protein
MALNSWFVLLHENHENQTLYVATDLPFQPLESGEAFQE